MDIRALFCILLLLLTFNCQAQKVLGFSVDVEGVLPTSQDVSIEMDFDARSPYRGDWLEAIVKANVVGWLSCPRWLRAIISVISCQINQLQDQTESEMSDDLVIMIAGGNRGEGSSTKEGERHEADFEDGVDNLPGDSKQYSLTFNHHNQGGGGGDEFPESPHNLGLNCPACEHGPCRKNKWMALLMAARVLRRDVECGLKSSNHSLSTPSQMSSVTDKTDNETTALSKTIKYRCTSCGDKRECRHPEGLNTKQENGETIIPFTCIICAYKNNGNTGSHGRLILTSVQLDEQQRKRPAGECTEAESPQEKCQKIEVPTVCESSAVYHCNECDYTDYCAKNMEAHKLTH